MNHSSERNRDFDAVPISALEASGALEEGEMTVVLSPILATLFPTTGTLLSLLLLLKKPPTVITITALPSFTVRCGARNPLLSKVSFLVK